MSWRRLRLNYGNYSGEFKFFKFIIDSTKFIM